MAWTAYIEHMDTATETAPMLNIQWKGTDACLDFHCPCQPAEDAYAFHFDGYFANGVRCPSCGAIYELTVTATRNDAFAGTTVDLQLF